MAALWAGLHTLGLSAQRLLVFLGGLSRLGQWVARLRRSLLLHHLFSRFLVLSNHIPWRARRHAEPCRQTYSGMITPKSKGGKGASLIPAGITAQRIPAFLPKAKGSSVLLPFAIGKRSALSACTPLNAMKREESLTAHDTLLPFDALLEYHARTAYRPVPGRSTVSTRGRSNP